MYAVCDRHVEVPKIVDNTSWTGVLTPSVPAPRGVGRQRRADQFPKSSSAPRYPVKREGCISPFTRGSISVTALTFVGARAFWKTIR